MSGTGATGALAARWPLAALLASLAALAAAHAFETFGRMAPCELCLRQREVYWAAAGLAALATAASFAGAPVTRVASGVLALVFLGGAAVAAYHAGVEWKLWPGPASCTGGAAKVSGADLQRFLAGGPVAVPQCDKPALVVGGLSMAGWNALLSLSLAGLSAWAAAQPAPPPPKARA